MLLLFLVLSSTSVNENQAYSFTPTASDPDGNGLTFSITNKPNWASFSTTTGALTGTPGYNKSGNYNSIVITFVTDDSIISISIIF